MGRPCKFTYTFTIKVKHEWIGKYTHRLMNLWVFGGRQKGAEIPFTDLDGMNASW